MIGALENALRKGWISNGAVTLEVLEGFLSVYGRRFYKLEQACDKPADSRRIRLEKRGDRIPPLITSAEGTIKVVPFRSNEQTFSLTWI